MTRKDFIFLKIFRVVIMLFFHSPVQSRLCSGSTGPAIRSSGGIEPISLYSLRAFGELSHRSLLDELLRPK